MNGCGITSFTVPYKLERKEIILHFGAVDWERDRDWVMAKNLETHRGGYDGFSFDITGALKEKRRTEVSRLPFGS
jgi:hypothetical protein